MVMMVVVVVLMIMVVVLVVVINIIVIMVIMMMMLPPYDFPHAQPNPFKWHSNIINIVCVINMIYQTSAI